MRYFFGLSAGFAVGPSPSLVLGCDAFCLGAWTFFVLPLLSFTIIFSPPHGVDRLRSGGCFLQLRRRAEPVHQKSKQRLLAAADFSYRSDLALSASLASSCSVELALYLIMRKSFNLPLYLQSKGGCRKFPKTFWVIFSRLILYGHFRPHKQEDCIKCFIIKGLWFFK